jgi:hypothetical protein
VSTTWSGPGHQHDHTIRTTLPAQTGKAVLTWTDYRKCACGHRIPATVTEVSVPGIGDDDIQRLRSHLLQPEPKPQAR